MTATMPVPHRWSLALAGDGRLTSTDLAIGRTLALHMDGRGGSCYPTHQLLAYEARVAERTVRLAVSHLVMTGWLTRVARAAPGRAAEYQATFPDVPEEARAHRNGGTGVPTNTGTGVPTLGQRRHGDAGERRHVTVKTPAPGCHPGSHQVAMKKISARVTEAIDLIVVRRCAERTRVSNPKAYELAVRRDVDATFREQLVHLAETDPAITFEQLAEAVEPSLPAVDITVPF